MKQYDVIVVGAGFAGSVIAQQLSSTHKVLVIEKRNHIGGNMYDYWDENGVLCHQYGPHIFHTNHAEVVDYLSQFTSFFPYEHRVLGYIDEQYVPIPFNLVSIEKCFDKEKAEHLKKRLIETYGMETKVPILKLRESEDEQIKELAEFIYEKVFKYYTMKQWGLSAEEIDPEVTARVPVYVSYDDRYFQDKYQQMPVEGYTHIFKNMLSHDNIDVALNTESQSMLSLKKGAIYLNGELFNGKVIYTGPIDELFKYQLGELPYRSLEFELKHYDHTHQQCGTVNYPGEAYPFTRISEYKYLMKNPPEKTTIAVEYPYAYNRLSEKGNIPYYPVFTNEVLKQYEAYQELAKQYPNLYLLGRLAQFKYYNMDAIILEALKLAQTLK